MANAAPQLQEAYDLIESGDLQSARQLLDDIRSDNENNPDFWWIYAHAIQDESDGIAALDRVRQLAPNYSGLQNLSEKIGVSSPQPQTIQSLRPTTAPPSTADVQEFYEEDDDFDVETSDRSGNGLMPFLMIAGITIVVIVAGLFFVSSLFNQDNGEGTATDVASSITDNSPVPIIPTLDSSSVNEIATNTIEAEPTATDEPPTVVPTDTDEPATEIPTEEPENTDPFADIYSALENSGVPEDGIVFDSTNSFGDTYLVTTCSVPGPVATQSILNIMDELESVADNLDESAEGFAFAITDCSTNTLRLTLGFDRATADSYWSGDITQVELQQSLQRVD